MRFFHLSDLHIGKQLHAYSLAEIQKDILSQIVDQAKEHKPDAILIAGDIYDKSVPSGEAYTIFDEFLNALAEIEPSIPALIISGNHDSQERLNFASAFMEKHGIILAANPPKEKDEYMKRISLEDEHGPVYFYLLPFIKPGHVRHLFEEGVITSYHSAVDEMIKRENIDLRERNVLLSHQFYVSGSIQPETCESEQAYINVGGLDSVDIKAVESFDYVALGHLHGPQSVGKSHIRYCGTPLKYSVSEEKHSKSISLITLGEKGSDVKIENIPLIPIRDVRSERGLMEEVMRRATQDNKNDYVSVTITDEQDPYNPKDTLEQVYSHLLELRIDNPRTRQLFEEQDGEAVDLDPLSTFRSFYEDIQQSNMTEVEEVILQEVIHTVRGEMQ